MRFCFKLGGAAALAVLGLSAAESSQAQTVPTRRITTLIRSDLRTGRLVRSVEVTAKPVMERTVADVQVPAHPVSSEPAAQTPPPPVDIEAAVERIAAEQSLAPDLIHSVIRTESNYNPYAVSPKGALGMMQLIPATALRFGVSDVFDPVKNIEGGARYLKYLLDLFGGNYVLALAAYNAGEAAVARYGGVPPYAETHQYVRSVAKHMDNRRKTAAQRPPPPAPVQTSAQAAPPGPAHIQEIVESDGRVRYVSR